MDPDKKIHSIEKLPSDSSFSTSSYDREEGATLKGRSYSTRSLIRSPAVNFEDLRGQKSADFTPRPRNDSPRSPRSPVVSPRTLGPSRSLEDVHVLTPRDRRTDNTDKKVKTKEKRKSLKGYFTKRISDKDGVGKSSDTKISYNHLEWEIVEAEFKKQLTAFGSHNEALYTTYYGDIQQVLNLIESNNKKVNSVLCFQIENNLKKLIRGMLKGFNLQLEQIEKQYTEKGSLPSYIVVMKQMLETALKIGDISGLLAFFIQSPEQCAATKNITPFFKEMLGGERFFDLLKAQCNLKTLVNTIGSKFYYFEPKDISPTCLNETSLETSVVRALYPEGTINCDDLEINGNKVTYGTVYKSMTTKERQEYYLSKLLDALGCQKSETVAKKVIAFEETEYSPVLRAICTGGSAPASLITLLEKFPNIRPQGLTTRSVQGLERKVTFHNLNDFNVEFKIQTKILNGNSRDSIDNCGPLATLDISWKLKHRQGAMWEGEYYPGKFTLCSNPGMKFTQNDLLSLASIAVLDSKTGGSFVESAPGGRPRIWTEYKPG